MVALCILFVRRRDLSALWTEPSQKHASPSPLQRYVPEHRVGCPLHGTLCLLSAYHRLRQAGHLDVPRSRATPGRDFVYSQPAGSGANSSNEAAPIFSPSAGGLVLRMDGVSIFAGPHAPLTFYLIYIY